MKIQSTSTTLLRDIASDSGNARWPEFVSRYRPMMLAYLKSRFPAVDADDIVQDTLFALSRALPAYRYSPDETGRFRNYLTGILRNKALKRCECERRDRALRGELLKIARTTSDASDPNDAAQWREAALEIAMGKLLDDERIPEKSKQIFQRLAVDGIPAEEVAAAYGTSRNNVDKTKSRMVARLREIVHALEEIGDV